MNLKGSLDAFGLPDVFALLAMTAKSGALRLHRTGTGARRDGVVWFHDGRITGASANCARQGLVRRLVGSGTVSDDALEAAVRSAAAGPIGVARALLEAGAVDGELVREAAVDQAVDAIFDLGRWDDGEFGFDLGAANLDDVGIALDHTWLITEATSRRASWDELRAVVPGEDARLALPVAVDDDPAVSREEWTLLAMIDGRRTVGELVELTGAGEFAVTTILAGLVRRGLLTVLAPGVDSDHVTTVVRRLRLLAQAEQLGSDAAASDLPEGLGGSQAAEPVADAADDTAWADADDADGGDDAPADAGDAVAEGASGDGADDGASDDGVDDGASDDGVDDGAAVAAAARGIPSHPTGPLSAAEALAAARAAQSRAAGEVQRPVARGAVVPPRPEPYLPGRRVEHPETATAYHGPSGGDARNLTPTAGATAMVAALGPAEQGIIERDPAVNRSLLLRLIAGVRGL